jgi:hypothetical protein
MNVTEGLGPGPAGAVVLTLVGIGCGGSVLVGITPVVGVVLPVPGRVVVVLGAAVVLVVPTGPSGLGVPGPLFGNWLHSSVRSMSA